MSVVQLLACITSEHGSHSLLIRKQKRDFSFIDMNAPNYYERLQQEFTRLHGLGWKPDPAGGQEEEARAEAAGAS